MKNVFLWRSNIVLYLCILAFWLHISFLSLSLSCSIGVTLTIHYQNTLLTCTVCAAVPCWTEMNRACLLLSRKHVHSLCKINCMSQTFLLFCTIPNPISTKSLHTLGEYHTSASANLNVNSLELGRHKLLATQFRLKVWKVQRFMLIL